MNRRIVGRCTDTVRTWYGPDGYDQHGFNRAGMHRDTRDRWGPDGRDRDGNVKPSLVPMLTR